MPTRLFAVTIALLATSVARATPDDLRSVAAMQSHQRVLLVFAPSLTDPRLKAQQREFAQAALAASERDLVLIQVGGPEVIGAHDDAEKLRRHYHVGAGDYRTLLIGKDGGVAMAIVGPIASRHLMDRIDAMPMRQDEIRRAREGKGQHQD